MPQGTFPVADVNVVNATALQQLITLQSPGTMISVGNPGGPVVFSTYGSPIIPVLAGGVPRSVVGQN